MDRIDECMRSLQCIGAIDNFSKSNPKIVAQIDSLAVSDDYVRFRKNWGHGQVWHPNMQTYYIDFFENVLHPSDCYLENVEKHDDWQYLRVFAAWVDGSFYSFSLNKPDKIFSISVDAYFLLERFSTFGDLLSEVASRVIREHSNSRK